MSTTCDHAGVALPDPMPEPTAAALRVRRNDAAGVDLPAVINAVAMAVCVARLLPRRSYSWTPAAACAAIRQHPDIAAVVDRNAGALCSRAAEALDVGILPDRTDLGLAERVAVVHRGDLAWSPDGVFRWWNGTVWERDDTGTLITERVKHTIRTLLPEETVAAHRRVAFLRKTDPDVKDDATKSAVKAAAAAAAFEQKAQSARAIRAAAELLRGEPGILQPVEIWDSNPRLMSAADVTLEFGDGGVKAREHRRDDHITMITRAAYRPRADRSRWEAFIQHALPDPAVREYFARLAGHTLLGGNTRRLLPLLVGPSSTGKTTALEAIAGALGDYAAPYELSLFVGDREGGRARPDLVAAMQRRMLFTTETQDRWALDADRLKRITGGDSASVRQVYSGQQQEGRPQFVPWIACNAAPRIRGADLALWRRLTAVPFDQAVPQSREDGELGARLREDADGVFAWLVEGLDRYLGDGGFGPVPDACTEAVRKIKTDLSLVDQWLDERCEAGDAYTATTTALADDLHAWSIWNRVPPAEHLSAIKLGKALTARGYGTDHRGGRASRERIRTGLRLAPDRDSIAPPDDNALPTTTARHTRAGRR